MSASWLQQPERGTAFALQLIAWIARVLGRNVARALLYPICAYFVCFSIAPRGASRNYLRRALGRPATWREIFRHYHTFAAVLLDRVFLVGGAARSFTIEVSGEPAIARLLARGEGCILLGAHFGSFEILRLVGRRNNLEVRVAMFEENAQKVARMFGRLDPRLKQSIIALGTPEAMLSVKETLDRGGIVGMLGDRVRAGGKTLRLPFLGGVAEFPLGPLQVACALRCPVASGFGIQHGDGRYHVRFEPLVEAWPAERAARDPALAAALRRYVALLEDQCRQAPFNWFNFYPYWVGEHETVPDR